MEKLIYSYNRNTLKDFLSRKRNFTVRKWYDNFKEESIKNITPY